MLSRKEWTKPSLEDFIAWLETKPKDEEYDWGDSRICPCGQYARSIGLDDWPSEMNARNRAEACTWYQFNELAYQYPRTFGDLLARALEVKLNSYHPKQMSLNLT